MRRRLLLNAATALALAATSTAFAREDDRSYFGLPSDSLAAPRDPWAGTSWFNDPNALESVKPTESGSFFVLMPDRGVAPPPDSPSADAPASEPKSTPRKKPVAP